MNRLGNEAWTRSMSEEVIAALWVISALLSFGFNFDAMGWICTIKAILDISISVKFSIKELKNENT